MKTTSKATKRYASKAEQNKGRRVLKRTAREDAINWFDRIVRWHENAHDDDRHGLIDALVAATHDNREADLKEWSSRAPELAIVDWLRQASKEDRVGLIDILMEVERGAQ